MKDMPTFQSEHLQWAIVAGILRWMTDMRGQCWTSLPRVQRWEVNNMSRESQDIVNDDQNTTSVSDG